MLTEKQISNFLKEDCPLKRAKMFKEIKDTTKKSYVYLSLHLYDSVRNLKRLYKLNNLIPEYVELYQKKVITKIVAYELSSLSQEQQKKTYQLFKEKFDKWLSKDVLRHLEEYQKSNEYDIELEIHFDNKKLMDTLANEQEEKASIEKKCHH